MQCRGSSTIWIPLLLRCCTRVLNCPPRWSLAQGVGRVEQLFSWDVADFQGDVVEGGGEPRLPCAHLEEGVLAAAEFHNGHGSGGVAVQVDQLSSEGRGPQLEGGQCVGCFQVAYGHAGLGELLAVHGGVSLPPAHASSSRWAAVGVDVYWGSLIVVDQVDTVGGVEVRSKPAEVLLEVLREGDAPLGGGGVHFAGWPASCSRKTALVCSTG